MKSMQDRVKQIRIRYTAEESKMRLRELILYIAERCQQAPRFGAVKLNKLLFFTDALSFLRHHEAVTGSQYIRLPQGPAPVHFKPLKEEMRLGGEIAIQRRRVISYTEEWIIPLRSANLDVFKARDIALVEEVVAVCYDRSGQTLSDMSHGIAWKVAADGDIIPYEALYLSNQGLTPVDIEEANKMIEKHGWKGAYA